MDFYETPIIGGIKCEHSLAFNIIKLYDFILHHSAEPFFWSWDPPKKTPFVEKINNRVVQCILESGRSRGLDE